MFGIALVYPKFPKQGDTRAQQELTYLSLTEIQTTEVADWLDVYVLVNGTAQLQVNLKAGTRGWSHNSERV